MRVFILEDCEIFRLSLELVLGQEPDIEVAGALSSSSLDICRQILDAQCDVLLLGLRLRNCSALEIARELQLLAPHIPLLSIGFSADEDIVCDLKNAGIKVFIPVSASNDFIANEIRRAHDALLQCDFSAIGGNSRISTQYPN